MSMAQANGSSVTVGELLAVLGRVRRQARGVWWATTLVGVVGIAALGLAAALLIDHLLVLPAIFRALLLLAVVAGPVWFVRRARRRRPAASDEELALLIERRYPSLDNALINSVQLSRQMPEGSQDIVAAITEEAYGALRAVRPAAAVSKRPLAIVGAVTALAGAVLAGHALTHGPGLATGLHRVLVPFADNTLTRIIEVTPGEGDYLAGEAVEVTVHVAGRVPTRAELIGTYSDGQRVRLGMAAASETRPDRLTARLDRLEHDLRYYIAAGDDRSGVYELRVHEAPTVQRITQRITPPEYVRQPPREASGGTIRALAGSRVELQIESATPFAKGTLTLGDGRAIPIEVPGSGPGAMGLAMVPVGSEGEIAGESAGDGGGGGGGGGGGADRYRIELTHALGFTSEPVEYDIIAERDRSPRVSIVEPEGDRAVAIDAQVRVRIEASDEYALRKLELVQLDPEWQNLSEANRPTPTVVAAWAFEPGEASRAARDHRVAVAELGLDDDAPVVLQALAYDFNPRGIPGRSGALTLRLEASEPEDESAEEPDPEYSRVSLDRLIAMQRENIAGSAASLAQLNEGDESIGLGPLVERQERIRARSLELAHATTGAAANNPVIQRRLRALAESLMVVAVRQLDRVEAASNRVRAMGEAIETQQEILKRLIVADARQDRELEAERHRQIAEALAELIARQRALHEDTVADAAQAGGLGARQRALMREAGSVQRMLGREADRGAGGNIELAEQYAAAAAAFDERAVRGNMIVVVERLGDGSLESAGAMQRQVIEDLRAIERLLRDAALRDAEEELRRVAESLRDVKEKLDRMVDIQESITEVARDLRSRADLRDDAVEDMRAQVRDLAEARENMADAIEQLARDLHIHPDLAVSNDLLAELTEIYEQVDQVEGSEEMEVTEMPVTRDEQTLARLKRMQEEMNERMPDAEMWLPDTPNANRFQRENFDRDELGEIPLGDLPDALEDLVGDMLDYNDDLREEALDTAANMHFPDHSFGQDVRDGDLVSWAAAGKSGNEPPQELDETGRAGPGRQGMSHGETVGDQLKALEGSDVHARRTQDGFQSGQIQEEDPDAFDVQATGGGKLAGVSPGEGMQGDAPARDLMHLREMARRHRDFERDAETVYSLAQLLRLPTGELDEALLQMHAARRQLESGDLLGYLHSQEQATRAFSRTHARLRGREIVAGGSAESDIAAAAIVGATQEPVPEHYEEAVAEYMRRIAERR